MNLITYKTYRKQFTNKAMNDRFFQIDLDLLKAAFEKDKKAADKPFLRDTRPDAKKRKARSLFKKVQKEVDRFVKGKPVAHTIFYGFNARGQPVQRSAAASDHIQIEKKSPAVLRLHYAHEYAHILQYAAGIGMEKCALEGHAMGIERLVGGDTFSIDLDARGKLYGNALMLMTGYSIIAREWNHPTISPETPILNFTNPEDASKYILGYCVFREQEEKQGKKIYRDILNGSFQFV